MDSTEKVLELICVFRKVKGSRRKIQYTLYFYLLAMAKGKVKFQMPFVIASKI